MRILLDTHALLWWLTNDPQLSPTALALIADEGNAVLVSAANAWASRRAFPRCPSGLPNW